LSFALEGVRRLELVAGTHTDLLAVSLSTTDAVGHRFGPDSRELHDQVLRLDRYLGAFIDSLYAIRDSARIVMVLTADHGVTPVPETRSRDPNQDAGRVDLGPIVASLTASLRDAGANAAAIRFEESFLLLDADELSAHNMNADAIARLFAQEVAKVPGVMYADRMRDLARRDTTTDYVARRWLHMLPPDLPVAVVVTLKPFWYWQGVNYATHGTPHDYDARVPIIFYGAGVKSGRNSQRALAVDIAPTLAMLIGVRPFEPLDGHVLRSVLRN
jgi:predicted AlkP superfamily pyrophosphatase or phosphodiesterase